MHPRVLAMYPLWPRSKRVGCCVWSSDKEIREIPNENKDLAEKYHVFLGFGVLRVAQTTATTFVQHSNIVWDDKKKQFSSNCVYKSNFWPWWFPFFVIFFRPKVRYCWICGFLAKPIENQWFIVILEYSTGAYYAQLNRAVTMEKRFHSQKKCGSNMIVWSESIPQCCTKFMRNFFAL